MYTRVYKNGGQSPEVSLAASVACAAIPQRLCMIEANNDGTQKEWKRLLFWNLNLPEPETQKNS